MFKKMLIPPSILL